LAIERNRRNGLGHWVRFITAFFTVGTRKKRILGGYLVTDWSIRDKFLHDRHKVPPQRSCGGYGQKGDFPGENKSSRAEKEKKDLKKSTLTTGRGKEKV